MNIESESIKTDITLLKYKDYVTRHPNKALGYYGLARLYMDLDSLQVPEEFLKKALEKDPGFMRAEIALIELYMRQGRFLRAVRLYLKHRQEIEGSRLYRSLAANAVTKVFETDRELVLGKRRILSLYILNTFTHILDLKKGSPAALMILGMHSAAGRDKSSDALSIYKILLSREGLSDSFRWHMLKALARYGPSLYKDPHTASLFRHVPKECTSEYANVIFKSALDSFRLSRITSVYKDLDGGNHIIYPSNLWRYIEYKRSISDLDNTVRDCCRRLLRAGWMDKIVAATLIHFHERKNSRLSPEEEKLFVLYGYLKKTV